jgi:hypothetical protein
VTRLLSPNEKAFGFPLGYHMKDDQIAVVEDEAERVRLIYRRYLELGPSCGRDNRLQHCCYAHFFKRD